MIISSVEKKNEKGSTIIICDIKVLLLNLDSTFFVEFLPWFHDSRICIVGRNVETTLE